MAMNKNDKVDVLPVLAQAVTGADSDPLMKEYLMEMIKDKVEQRRKEKLRAERRQLNAIQAAKEEMEAQASRIRSCNHMKQDNREPRTGGQFVSGTGQLVVTCGYCGKVWHNPPREPGQEACPQNLLPNRDIIGG